MNIRFHFHDTNGNACCKVQDMSTSAYVHLYCTSDYDLQAYETTFTNHTGTSDTNVFEISTPMAHLDGTNYSVQLYEDNGIVTPYVVYHHNDGIAYVSFDTVNSDVSFTLRINNIGNSDYMLDEPYINPDAQFITPTYTGFNLMAQSLGTDYDNIQNNTQNQQTYSTNGTVVHVQNVVNIVLTVQANEGTPYKVNIDGNIYYLDSNNQVTVQAANYFQLNGVYDANDAKYLRVDASYFGACDDYNMSISSDTTITVNDLTSAGHTHYSPNYDMPVSGTWTDGNNTLQTWNGDGSIEYNGNYYDYNYNISTNSMYYIEREGCDYQDGIISDTFVYDSTNDEWTYEGNTFTRSTPSQPDLTGRYYFNSQDSYIIFFSTSQSLVFGACGSASAYNYEWVYTDHWTVRMELGGGHYYLPYDENNDTFEDSGSLYTYSDTDPCGTPSQPDLTGRYFYNENRPNDGVIYFNSSSVFAMGTCNATVDYGYTMTYDSSTGLWNIVFQRGPDSVTMYYDQNYNTIELYGYTYTYSSTDPCGTPSQPDLTGRYYFDSTNNYVIYFTNNQSLEFGACGEELNPRNYEWEYTDHWRIKMGANYMDYDENANTIEFGGVVFTYSSTDPCGGPGPQPTEKHIYLCDNSGAHLAEMTNTGSTWTVTGSFTSGMYSIRATVTNEYEDAWFKFYQTSGDNRVFVGAGDDPSFEDIGTYIMIDDILTSFSLTEDQETGYYVVNYQNTEAMTVSTVETIVNSYIGDFVTGSEISAMGYMTQTDISSMSYVDQTSLSAMSYVDNSYLSTYMNNVVGNIESILQTI